MKAVFLDTSFLIGLMLTDDALHDRALAWQQAMIGPFVTTEYVLVELVDALIREPLRPLAVTTVQILQDDPMVQIIPASSELFRRGLEFFDSRRDKRWSLTDCISFIIMEQHGIIDALTNDQHFEQAGFVALLRKPPPGAR